MTSPAQSSRGPIGAESAAHAAPAKLVPLLNVQGEAVFVSPALVGLISAGGNPATAALWSIRGDFLALALGTPEDVARDLGLVGTAAPAEGVGVLG